MSIYSSILPRLPPPAAHRPACCPPAVPPDAPPPHLLPRLPARRPARYPTRLPARAASPPATHFPATCRPATPPPHHLAACRHAPPQSPPCRRRTVVRGRVCPSWRHALPHVVSPRVHGRVGGSRQGRGFPPWRLCVVCAVRCVAVALR